MAKEATFVLERAPFTTKDGKEMYGYFVSYKIHGKNSIGHVVEHAFYKR